MLSLLVHFNLLLFSLSLLAGLLLFILSELLETIQEKEPARDQTKEPAQEPAKGFAVSLVGNTTYTVLPVTQDQTERNTPMLQMDYALLWDMLTEKDHPTFCHCCASDLRPEVHYRFNVYGEYVAVCSIACYYALLRLWAPSLVQTQEPARDHTQEPANRIWQALKSAFVALTSTHKPTRPQTEGAR